KNQPRAATAADNLTPKIEQVRNGAVIATWKYLGAGKCGGNDFGTYAHPQISADKGCGPFGRSHFFQTWQNGDTFLAYPAVYNTDDDANQPFIAPNYETVQQYNNNLPNTPTNITIKGVTVNGVRPVFLVDSAGGASNIRLS